MPSSLQSTCAPGPTRSAQPRLDRQAPRRVHALAERRQDAHAPVAELVAEAFDDDRAVVGDGAGRLALIVNVLDQVLRRELVEPDVVAQARERIGAAPVAQLARERAERAAELERAAGLVALPERHLAGLAGRGRDHDAVARDVLDPPRAARPARTPRRAGSRTPSPRRARPTRVPSGRNTPKSPRSGIVPPRS